MVAIDHLGVAVADLEGALRWYSEVLGLVVVHREDNPEQGVVEAMLGAPGAGRDDAQLQLVAPLGSDSPIALFLDRRGPGLQHLAFRVRDLALANSVLRQRGCRLIYDSPRAGTRGSLINFLHPRDTGGVLVELVQPADDEGVLR